MKYLYPTLIPILILFILFYNLRITAQEKILYPRKLKIGVVDFSKAGRGYKKFKKIIKKLKDEDKKRKNEIERLRMEAETLVKELKVLNPDSRFYKRKERELAKTKAEIKFLWNKYQKEMRELYTKYMKEIIDDLEEAIKAYGKKKGFDVILRRYLPIKQGQMQMDFNTVIYYDQNLDITQQIIERINSTTHASTSGSKISNPK
ncbi:MAG: OmpH family outer membrane protein [Planctomycetota bacterium]|nr:MAG: OmpH family outer membrane protein [Planctomycetota bacterium]